MKNIEISRVVVLATFKALVISLLALGFSQVSLAQINGTWANLPGSAKDIGIGADGSIWIIDPKLYNGGYGIHCWNDSAWDEVGGAATDISVGENGLPWVVNSSNTISKRVSTANTVQPTPPQGNAVTEFLTAHNKHRNKKMYRH